MSLSTFLDIVWKEIYDDAAPLGDRGQYRDIVRKMYLEGVDPYEIWYVNDKGKRVRLADAPSGGGKIEKRGIEALRALQDRANKLAADARAEHDQ